MNYNFPRQSISYKKKTKEWRINCMKFADSHSILSSSSVRRTVAHKKLNYDLLNGKVNMADLIKLLNTQGFKYERKDMFTPIPHYPIVNRCVDVLVGEETASQLDFKAVITNPTAISEKEKNKKAQLMQSLQQLIEDTSLTEEEFQQKTQELAKYYNYEYQDIREMRANELLNHYSKEQNYKNIFLDAFVDVLAVNEAIFQISLEHGEPVLRKLNPNKVHVYGNGASNRIEDADMIVIEDYWQRGRILDTYADKLTLKDIKFLEDLSSDATGSVVDDSKYGDAGDPLTHFMFGEYAEKITLDDDTNLCFEDGTTFSQLPYDINGNIRVLQVYWKSMRKIQEIKYYDPETGKTEYKFVNEDYIPDEANGEESKFYYINEAWQGVMIGAGEQAIYVNLGPCPIQYNRMSNPSKCHFGIIGQIFNINESKPYSIIDKIKPFAYLYDAIMDKFVKTVQNNMGKIVQFNGAMMPEGWKFEDWIYYAKTAGIVMVNPMKEGTKGAAKGKIAGAFQVPNVIDAELGNSLQYMVSILQYIETSLCNMLGITPQRLGAIQNRETVGGVERSTLQSSHVTRWYFEKYNDLKKRVMECVLETAKIGAKGHIMKFQNIMSDLTMTISDFDGDEFAECDYGLVVSTDYDVEKFRQEIDQAAGMALQGGMISFSAYLKLKSSGSMSEKIKMIEQSEQEMREYQQQQQQAALQQQQAQAEAQLQMKQAELQQDDAINQRDNETKILVANIQAMSKKDADSDGVVNEKDSNDLTEQVREFDEKMKLEREKLDWDKKKNKDNNDVKIQIAKSRPKTNNNK